MPKYDSESIKKDFPILEQEVNGKRLVYLDNGATTQKPIQVIKAMDSYNQLAHGNPHRGAHRLSVMATQAYDSARERVRSFINAEFPEEIIFTSNTTESINLVARSYGMDFISKGDEILLSITEHHSNILPWQQVAKSKGAILKYMYLDDDYRISSHEIKEKITERTKLVALGHMSNVLGTIHPVKEVINRAHEVGALVLVDGAQAAPHMKVDVRDLDADFYVFSAHKMLGPMGLGVLYGKKDLLNSMSPFLLGGDMIEYVDEQDSSFAPLPFKFEAGTQNVEGAVGLEAAIDYLEEIGLENIYKYEMELTSYALEEMSKIPYVSIQGPRGLEQRAGIISFTIDDIHPHDVASILDSYGIAIRAGHHCAQPLMKYLGLNSTSRASFYLYNTREDVDDLISAIKNVRKWLGYGS